MSTAPITTAQDYQETDAPSHSRAPTSDGGGCDDAGTAAPTLKEEEPSAPKKEDKTGGDAGTQEDSGQPPTEGESHADPTEDEDLSAGVRALIASQQPAAKKLEDEDAAKGQPVPPKAGDVPGAPTNKQTFPAAPPQASSSDPGTTQLVVAAMTEALKECPDPVFHGDLVESLRGAFGGIEACEEAIKAACISGVVVAIAGDDGENSYLLPPIAGAANSGSGEVEPNLALAEQASTGEPADERDGEERDKCQPSLLKGACGASDGPTGGTEADEAQGTRLFIAGYLVHPLAALFPPLPEDELRQLADSIERGKLRNRIIVHKGEILDGCNRARAIELLGQKLDPKVHLIEWDGVGSIEDLILDQNMARRQMNAASKAILADRWATAPTGRPGKGGSAATLSRVCERVGISKKMARIARSSRTKGLKHLLAAAQKDLVPLSILQDVAAATPEELTRLDEEVEGLNDGKKIRKLVAKTKQAVKARKSKATPELKDLPDDELKPALAQAPEVPKEPATEDDAAEEPEGVEQLNAGSEVGSKEPTEGEGAEPPSDEEPTRETDDEADADGQHEHRADETGDEGEAEGQQVDQVAPTADVTPPQGAELEVIETAEMELIEEKAARFCQQQGDVVSAFKISVERIAELAGIEVVNLECHLAKEEVPS